MQGTAVAVPFDYYEIAIFLINLLTLIIKSCIIFLRAKRLIIKALLNFNHLQTESRQNTLYFVLSKKSRAERKTAMNMKVIDIGDKVNVEYNICPKKGQYAFWEALPFAIVIFGMIIMLGITILEVVKFNGIKIAPVNPTYAGTILLVAGLFLGQLISTANQRFDQDHMATGTITTAFRMLVHGVGNDLSMSNLLGHLAWSMFYFFSGESVEIVQERKTLEGFQPILRIISKRIDRDSSLISTEKKAELLSLIKEIQSALGGINRRRTYGILKSRYIVNGMFSSAGVFLMTLSALTNPSPAIGLLVAFVFTYGLTTAMIYVKHMESGIGYDPGDVRPDLCLKAWMKEREAARDDNYDVKT